MPKKDLSTPSTKPKSTVPSDRPSRALPVLDPLQRYSISEADSLLRQSRSKTYEDIANGVLRVTKDGARTYVPGSEIIRRSALSQSA